MLCYHGDQEDTMAETLIPESSAQTQTTAEPQRAPAKG
jgi:hypothetical protein